MPDPIPAHDRAHFAAVQHALLADGLHLAMVSAVHGKLTAYAGALARALAQAHGWRVEAYQASRLEAVVAELMLGRFDAALSRISAASPAGSPGGQAAERGCVLFIPNAQALPIEELDQLLRVATGVRRLRLVALFDGGQPQATASRLRRMGDQLAHWALDEEAEDEQPAALPRRTAVEASGAAAARPSRLRLAGMVATAAMLVLALLPAAPWRNDPAHADSPPAVSAAEAEAARLSISGRVQLAGDPPAAFVRAADAAPPPATAGREAAR